MPLSVVRWSQTLPCGALDFELRSSHALVLRCAANVFRPFLAESHLGRAPMRRFRVEPRAGTWDVTCEATNCEAANCENVNCEAGALAARTRTAASSVHDGEPVLLAGGPPQVADTLELAIAIVEFAVSRAVAEYASVSEQRDVFGLHGALLERNERGVLILGLREAGKSTLSCALWQRGWHLLSDDYALIESANLQSADEQDEPQMLRAFGVARRASLRPGSRALLGEKTWQRVLAAPGSDCLSESGRVLFHPRDINATTPNAAATSPGSGATTLHETALHALLFLNREGAPARDGLCRLESSRALFALLAHVGLSNRDELPIALQRLGPLAGAVPAFDLRRAPLAHMADACDSL